MRASCLLILYLAGLIVCQSNSDATAPPASVSTSLSTSVGLDSNRQTTSQVITSLVTLQPASTTAAPTGGNATAAPSGNSTNSTAPSGNGTSPGTTSSSSVTLSNLPTANPSVDGGGNAAGAPSPGAYGPGDSYVAGALLVKANIALVLAGVGFSVLL